MNVQASPQTAPRINAPADRLRVTSYDRVSSMLLALLLLIGATVLTLLLIWLTGKLLAAKAVVPVTMEQIGEGGGAMGDDSTLEEPSLSETDLVEPEPERTLAVVASAVASRQAVLADPAIGQAGGGAGGGGRMAGSGDGTPGIPRHWEVVFAQSTLETYARQLDYFGIELAVLGDGDKVVYARNVSSPTPTQESRPRDQEKRYYLTWRHGGLQEADRELLKRAKISTEGRLILKFLPPGVEANLAAMEKSHAGADSERIAKTQFGILSTAGGYEFYISEQTLK